MSVRQLSKRAMAGAVQWRLLLLLLSLVAAAAAASFGTALRSDQTRRVTGTRETQLMVIPGQAGSASYLDSIKGAGSATSTAARPTWKTNDRKDDSGDRRNDGSGGRRQRLQRVLSSLRTGSEKDDKPQHRSSSTGGSADRDGRTGSSHDSGGSGGKLQRVLDFWGGMRRGSGASSSSRLSLSSPWKSSGGAATTTAYAGFPGAPWSPSALESPKMSIPKPRAWWSSSAASDTSDATKSDSNSAADGASPTTDYLSAMSKASSNSASTTKDSVRSYKPGESSGGSSSASSGGFPGAAWSPNSLETSTSSASSKAASSTKDSAKSYKPGESSGGGSSGGFPGAAWSPNSLETSSTSTSSSESSYAAGQGDAKESTTGGGGGASSGGGVFPGAPWSPSSLSSTATSSSSTATTVTSYSSGSGSSSSQGAASGGGSAFPGAAWSPSSLETPSSSATPKTSFSPSGDSSKTPTAGFPGAAWSPSSLETPASSETAKASYNPGGSRKQTSAGGFPGAAWSPNSLEGSASSETPKSSKGSSAGSSYSQGSTGGSASGFPGAAWSPSSLETSPKRSEYSEHSSSTASPTAWSESSSFPKQDGYGSQSTAYDYGSRNSNERDRMHASSSGSPQLPAWVTNKSSGSDNWASSTPSNSYNEGGSSTTSYGSSSDYRSAMSKGSTGGNGNGAAFSGEQPLVSSGSSSQIGQTMQSDWYSSTSFGAESSYVQLMEHENHDLKSTSPASKTDYLSVTSSSSSTKQDIKKSYGPASSSKKVTSSSGFPGSAWSPSSLDPSSSSSTSSTQETSDSASPTSDYLSAMSKSSPAQSGQKKSYGPGTSYKSVGSGGFPGASWSPNSLESTSSPSTTTTTTTTTTRSTEETSAQSAISSTEYSHTGSKSSSSDEYNQKQSHRGVGSIGATNKDTDSTKATTTSAGTTNGVNGAKQYYSGFLGGMSVESSVPSSSSKYQTQGSDAYNPKNGQQMESSSPDSERYFSGFLGGMSSPSTAPSSTSDHYSKDQSTSEQRTNRKSIESTGKYGSTSVSGFANSQSDRRVADTFKPRIRESTTRGDQYASTAYTSSSRSYDTAPVGRSRSYSEPSLPSATRTDDFFTYSAPVPVVDEELRQSVLALQQDVERLANQLAGQGEDLQALQKLGQSLLEKNDELRGSTRLEESEAFIAMQSEIKGLSERLGILEDIQVEAERRELVKDQTASAHVHHHPPLVPLNNYTEPSASDVLYLNVGGMKLDVLRGTLTLFPDSLLAQQFCGEWDDRLLQDEEGRYMIDEDPELFVELVNHLRERSRRTDRRVGSQAVVDPPSFRGRPGLQARFHRLVDSYALTRHLYGMSICTVHEDPLPSAEPVAGALLTPVENRDADFRDFVLQRDGRHERNVETFEIELGPGTCGAVGWSIYDMDRFDGFCFDHDERVVLAILYIYRTGLQESITFRLGDVTKTIPTSAVIRDDQPVRVRCAKRGAEWYVNDVLVAQTPAVCRALSHRVDPAPFVSCTQGSVCFTDIQYVP